jgi:L-amino acid N-acyltransferase YncA
VECVLIPYDANRLSAVADLLPEEQTLESLGRDLVDAARAQGRQVVMAQEEGVLTGVAGWVAFGVETEGIVYGAPVLARTEASAVRLLERLIHEAKALGARQLRVSLLPEQTAKARALAQTGFHPLLDMISVERPSHDLPPVPMPGDLREVPFEEVDWERFTQLFNTVFAEVPNAPPVDTATKREEWDAVDREASSIWIDAEGRYVAWIGVLPGGHIDDVGVDASLRGRSIAPALYARIGGILAAKGILRLEAMLASTNTATLRLHEKLGFREFARRTVFGLDLQANGVGG